MQLPSALFLHVGYSQAAKSIMQAELKKMLSTKPFIPFTVIMSDGTHVTVKHPATALLTKHWLYVTTDGGETPSICTCCT